MGTISPEDGAGATKQTSGAGSAPRFRLRLGCREDTFDGQS
jgi:hypothetical protein